MKIWRLSKAQVQGLLASVIIAALLLIFLLAKRCGTSPPLGGPVQQALLSDGEFVGSAHNINEAQVQVTIKDKRIATVRILSLDSSPYGDKARAVIPARIVSEQSTQVDAVTGATEASQVIMNAAEAAVRKSYEAYEQNL